MKRTLRVLALLAAAILVLAGCSDDDDTAGDTTDDTPATEQPTNDTTGDSTDDTGDDATDDTTEGDAGDVAVQTGETDLGTVLVDGSGMTLYVFTQDEAGVSNCTGGCAGTWPPLEAGEDFAVGGGLDASIFSTIQRDDGSTQLAVNGMPLYRYAADTAAGDTTGQGVGDVWFAVGPDGELIES